MVDAVIVVTELYIVLDIAVVAVFTFEFVLVVIAVLVAVLTSFILIVVILAVFAVLFVVLVDLRFISNYWLFLYGLMMQITSLRS